MRLNKVDDIFGLINTNGRRSDMLNAYQIYIHVLDELNITKENQWKAWPATCNQFLFYKKVIESPSNEVFKQHKPYDDFTEVLENDFYFSENFLNLKKDEIYQNKKYKKYLKKLDEGIEARARHYTSNLVRIGMINENRVITENGRALLNPEIIFRDFLEKELPISNVNVLFLRQALKFRVYTNDGEGYYSPIRLILYILLSNLKRQVGVDILSIVQRLNPYNQVDVDKLCAIYFENGIDAAKKFVYGGSNWLDSKIFSVDFTGKITKDDFDSKFFNRKSKNAIEVYREFYDKLWDFRNDKSRETLAKLIEIFDDKEKKAKINKAFGYNKSIFKFPNLSAEDSVEKFLLENKDVRLLNSVDNDEFNSDFYFIFRDSKNEDDIKEKTSEIRRLLEVTGLFSTSNGIIDLIVDRELFAEDSIIEKLRKSIFVRKENENSDFTNYEDYEEKQDAPFKQLDSLMNILGIKEEVAFNQINFIKSKYNITSNGSLKEDALEIQRDKEFKKYVDAEFPEEKVFQVLSLFSDRSNDNKIKKIVTQEADVPTIFEYIVGLAWYYLSDDKNYNLRKSYNLILNSNFLPVGHAPGGDGDIIIKYNDLVLMIEVTLMNKHAQKRGEWEPVLRHSINLSIDSKLPTLTLFVADELDSNTINIWRAVASVPLESSKEAGRYTDESVKIMPLKIKDLLEFKNRNFSSNSLIKQVNSSFEKLINKDFDMEWRDKMLDGIY